MTTPVIALQAMQVLAAGLGGYCLILWFQKSRKQAIIAFHLLAGLGGIEALIGFLHIERLRRGLAGAGARDDGREMVRPRGLHRVLARRSLARKTRRSPTFRWPSMSAARYWEFFTTLSFARQAWNT